MTRLCLGGIWDPVPPSLPCQGTSATSSSQKQTHDKILSPSFLSLCEVGVPSLV